MQLHDRPDLFPFNYDDKRNWARNDKQYITVESSSSSQHNQVVTALAQSGNFTLSLGPFTSPPIPHNATEQDVQMAVQNLM